MKSLFENLSISLKIGVVFFLLLVMMGMGGLLGLYNAEKVAEVTKELYTKGFKKVETISTVEREFLGQRQKLILLTIVSDDGSKSYLKDGINGHSDKIDTLLSEYEAEGGGEGVLFDLSVLRSTLGEYRSLQDRIIAISTSGDRERAMTLVRVEGNKGFNLVENAINAILEKESDAARVAFAESEHFSGRIRFVTLLFTIIAIVLAAAFWLILTRSIVAPIFAIGASAKRMAGGDLTQRAPIQAGDEIGTLAAEFNRMAESLQGYYSTLEGKVEERTEELDDANKELARRKAELELKNEELAKASRMKSQFLANVSHELRTPLNSIIGFSELLGEKTFGELNEKQGQYVDYIHTSGAHLLELINSILDLSKIEAGRMELIPEEFSLGEVLDGVVGSVRHIAEKRGIILHVKDMASAPVIRADRGKFKQVMLNLLSNAVKFNNDGGTVDLDWSLKEKSSGGAVERTLVISVKDTGIGIKAEDLSKLFGEFEQLNPEVTRDYGGTGLGLALTKKLVELHDGTIDVESEVGSGCTFTVTFPQGAEMVDAAGHDGEARLGEKVQGAPLILVAAESEDVNQLLDIYLTSEGYNVMTAVDGEELLRLAAEKVPFAIVMDVELRKKDGWDVLSELKSSAVTSHIPAVMISTSENLELGFSLGAVDYLLKPVSRESLLATLSRLDFDRRGFSRILVVDDDPKVLRLLADMLGNEGYEVLQANGGSEAVGLARDKLPDLIILDLMMPVVSGFDVAEMLKEDVLTKNIPIVVFSAKDITVSEKERLGENIKKIIKKAGFSKKDLLSELKLIETAYPAKAKMIDDATGLFNMRYFEIALSREVGKSTKLATEFSVIMVRVDNLKRLRVSMGLASCDEILREVAKFMKGHMRKTDCMVREGDDLLVILPSITGSDVNGVAEKLRGLVEKHSFDLNGSGDGSDGGSGNDKATVSIAGVTLPLDSEINVVATLGEILDESTAGGGNRVSLFGGGAVD